MNNHLISWMIALPLLGVLLQAILPEKDPERMGFVARWIAIATSLAASVCAVVLVGGMNSPQAELQGTEFIQWVGLYAISYEVGVDGLNALLVLLVATLFPILVAAEWDQKVGARGLFGLFLLLQSSFFGVVCAQDLFLQFFFWAMTAVPFYFLIGIWGGEARESAAFRFIVSAAIGNALLFAALVLVYYSVDPHSFSLKELTGSKFKDKTLEVLGGSISVPVFAFVLIGAGLALRAAIWPVHGWFINVAKEAPLTVFVSLSGVMLPVATYIFMRLGYSLFPETMPTVSGVIVGIGGLNLLLGSIFALAQRNLRLLLGYFSMGEVGLLLLGIGSLESAGSIGVVYQQMVLGLGVAGFGLFASLLEDRVGHCEFRAHRVEDRPLGGVATQAPQIALISAILISSLLGIPGLGGFVSRSLVYIGAYPSHPAAVSLAVLAGLLATYYFFTMYRYIFLGPAGRFQARIHDLNIREQAYLFPLVLMLLMCGVYPKPLLELVRPTVLTLLSTVK